MQPVQTALIYLVQTLVSLYVLAILLRFLLQVARADFYNPISQTIVKITDPALRPLRRFIPGVAGLDLSSLVLALLVQMAGICLIYLLVGAGVPNPLAVLGWGAIGLFSLTLDIYFWALLIMVILSWVAPGSHHPGAQLIQQLVEPIARPARNLIPPIGGLDISIIFVFIAINLIEILVLGPLAAMAAIPRNIILGL